MTVKVGSARIDERGKIYGGKAGDQSGRELWIQDGYVFKGGWDYCIRIKDSTKRKRFIAFIKWACNNKHIGYDQHNRLALYNELKRIGFKNYRNLSKDVEVDCSALVACGLIVAGFDKINPSCYTGNLRSNIKSTYPKSFTFFDNGYKYGDHTQIMKWWRNGDILLKEGHHVVTVVSGGRQVVKRSDTYYKKYTGKSIKIDEVFASINVPSKYRGSVTKRKPIAIRNGIKDYDGKEVQNLTLISMAKSGKLKKP